MAIKESSAEKMSRMVEEKKRADHIRQLEREGKQVKYVREYFNENKEVTSRWHFDLRKSMNGPYLVEDFEYNKQSNSKD